MILLILSITILLFVWGKWPPDIVALISMLSLFLSGILTLEETLSGFSNSTVIMIGALFIVGEGMAQTGWTALAGQKLIEWSKGSTSKLLTLLTLGSGLLSGFVSNTGTVATLLPVTVAAAWNIGTLPSKMLMPVAFGSNTGGLLTLTGTPPNIIVSNSLEQKGIEAFSFFEIGLIGLPLLLTATLYFRYFGGKLLPSNETSNKPVSIKEEMARWMKSYHLEAGYFRLMVPQNSNLVGKSLEELAISKKFDVIIGRLKRRRRRRTIFTDFPTKDTRLQANDVITVKSDLKSIEKLTQELPFQLQPWTSFKEALKDNVISQEMGMAEIIIVPKSALVGRTLNIGQYLERFEILVLGGSRNNEPLEDKEITIQAGDSFLIRGKWKSIERLYDLYKDLVIYGNIEGMPSSIPNLSTKSYFSLFALIMMITLMVFKVVPNVMAVLLAALVTVFSGSVPMSKMYKSISWTSVIMIAAMIPMGIALQKTGIAQAAADGLVNYLGAIDPLLMLAGIFLLTSMFSQVINNSATAVLMAPIAILAATALGISAKPFMIVVAVSASTAFLTPVGTTTNAMVMSAGGYKFSDYLKVGTPLLLIFLTISLFIIPAIWPL